MLNLYHFYCEGTIGTFYKSLLWHH